MTSLRLSTGTRGSVPAGGSTAARLGRRRRGGVGVRERSRATAPAAASGVQSRSGTFVVGCSVSGSGGGAKDGSGVCSGVGSVVGSVVGSWLGAGSDVQSRSSGGGSGVQSLSGTLVVGCSVTDSGSGSGSGARWEPTCSAPAGGAGSWARLGRRRGRRAPARGTGARSRSRRPSTGADPACSGSGYQPAGVGGVVIEWGPSRLGARGRSDTAPSPWSEPY